MYYRPRKTNVEADMLSRLPVEDGHRVIVPREYIRLIDLVDVTSISFYNIHRESLKDPEISFLIRKIRFR